MPNAPQAGRLNPDKGAPGFIASLCIGLVWLLIGVLAGRYLFPETIEKVETQIVEKVVTQRIEVPVDKIVYKEVLREVSNDPGASPERVVIREVPVPVPMAFEAQNVPSRSYNPAWKEIKSDMTSDEVRSLLGPPDKIVEDDETSTWFYEEKDQGVVFTRFKKGGIFSKDRLALWMAPDPKLKAGTGAGATLLTRARKARETGNAALALVYAQSALSAEPGDQEATKLIDELIAEISARRR